ncbi:MAG: helix-turn-helix domain-containing protein [Acidobacteriota bacterium]
MAKPYPIDCPVAVTLDAIGERWTMLLVRDLYRNETRRFADFLESFPSLSPGILSSRLKSLEEHGVVERRFYQTHPPRAEYLLTQRGRELGPVLQALKNWGLGSPQWVGRSF